MAPELFAAAVAQVPFVDTINTMLDPTLPLTVTEWEEWGNPGADESIYRAMRAYSPYENVARVGVPGGLRQRWAQRSAGRVLGTGEMGATASGAVDQWAADPACGPISERGTADRRVATTPGEKRPERWPS